MKVFLFTLLSFITLSQANCQSADNGRILRGKVESADGQAKFATVGIIGANVGTITDQKGNFVLDIPAEFIKQKLTISHIGYETRELAIDSLLMLDTVVVALAEKN